MEGFWILIGLFLQANVPARITMIQMEFAVLMALKIDLDFMDGFVNMLDYFRFILNLKINKSVKQPPVLKYHLYETY